MRQTRKEMITTFVIKGNSGEVVEIATKGSFGYRWSNPIAHLLPDCIEVHALDFPVTGIITIGFIRELIDYDI